MKRITIVAITMLIIGLIGIAVGGSFFMAGTQAARPEKGYADFMSEGERYLNNGEYYKAVVSFESALEEKTDDRDALDNLADVYSRQLDYEKEMDIRDRITALDPADLDNQTRIITLMISRGELDEAKAKTEELLATVDSEDLRALYREMNIEAPAFNLSPGDYAEYQLLELNSVYSNATVHYTLDGSEPYAQSPVFVDGIVISYPETTLRAKAFGVLGYESPETRLEFTISKPAEDVTLNRRIRGNVLNSIRTIGSMVLNKSWDSPIYNYELAQIRELYLVGNNIDREQSYSFFAGYYKYYENVYRELGTMTLDFAAYTPYLKTLAVAYQEKLDLKPLSSLQYLENLSLLNDSIVDITPLEGVHSLKKLALGWNKIADVKALSGLSELESLGLWNNLIQDASPLASLEKLQYLDLSYNKVERIDCVANMSELNEVWVNNNMIQDLSPLAGCERLMILMQANNPARDYSSLRDAFKLLYKSDIDWGDVQ